MAITNMKLVQYLTFFILFTALTKTYVWWASLLHVSVGMVSTLFLLITILLLGLNIKNYKYKLPKRWTRPIFMFFLIAPIIVSIVTLNAEFRVLVLQIFYVVTFLLAYQTYSLYGKKFIFKMIFIAFIFTGIFGIYSMYNPQYFYSFGEITNALTFYHGRAFGFYLQPNSYAIAINLMFIALIVLSPSIKYVIYLTPITLLILLGAGSKTNIAAFAIILFFVYLFIFKYHKKQLMKHSTLMFTLLILFIGILGMQLYEKIQNNDEFSGLYNRLEFVFLQDDQSNLSNITEDASMVERIKAQKRYIKVIADSPLVGYGIGARDQLIDKGILSLNAHNTPLEILLEGGILYLLFFIYFCVYLIKNYFYYKKKMGNNIVILGYGVFLLFMFYYFIFSTTLFSERVVFVIFGIVAFALNQKVIEKRGY